ncbi:MAG: permease [Planctomycetes bacterium]|nr:permease [Planctomycetota bacterium]
MLLAISFLALLLGPLVVWLARRHAGSSVALDSFCLVTISGFVLLHVLPECAEQAGWLVLPLAFGGFLLPTLAERTLHGSQPGVRGIVLVLALLGMAAHTTLDGFFLTDGSHHEGHGHTHSHEVTAWAIILHRIPAGIGIWWIVPRTLGTLAAVLVSLVVIGGTLFGYFLGVNLLNETSQRGLALLQALLAGSLLHVVLHAHIPAPREQGRFRVASVIGALASAIVLVIVIRNHFPRDVRGPADVFLRLATESAPALLVAYLLVGLCHAFLPTNWLGKMTRGPVMLQALRGVAVGLPLPVCSCGVVPIYRELVRQGASIVAALAFLVATPELELAAVTLTWHLMGPDVALMRAAMAAVLALGVGVVVGSMAGRLGFVATDSDSEALRPKVSGSFLERLGSALRFGYGPAVDSTATWILSGLLLSALLMPYVDRDWIASLPRGIDVPVAALIGLPIYVCATGSTPVAAMLLVQGLSPGAVLAFLLTGPATNITTFGVLARLHGLRTAFGFAIAMWTGAVGLGYAANALIPTPVVPALTGSGHAHSPLHWLLLSGLGAVFLFSLLRQGVRPFLERLFESPANLGHDHDHRHGHDHGHDHGHAHGCCHGAEPDPAPPQPKKSCCH